MVKLTHSKANKFYDYLVTTLTQLNKEELIPLLADIWVGLVEEELEETNISFYCENQFIKNMMKLPPVEERERGKGYKIGLALPFPDAKREYLRLGQILCDNEEQILEILETYDKEVIKEYFTEE